MKFRPARGTLEKAMNEAVVLDNTIEALAKHVGEKSGYVLPETITVEPYSDTPDDRIGWAKTYIVMIDYIDGKRSPFGYTDEMPISKQGDKTMSETIESLKSCIARIEARIDRHAERMDQAIVPVVTAGDAFYLRGLVAQRAELIAELEVLKSLNRRKGKG